VGLETERRLAQNVAAKEVAAGDMCQTGLCLQQGGLRTFAGPGWTKKDQIHPALHKLNGESAIGARPVADVDG
jgi:hypothetical protein